MLITVNEHMITILKKGFSMQVFMSFLTNFPILKIHFFKKTIHLTITGNSSEVMEDYNTIREVFIGHISLNCQVICELKGGITNAFDHVTRQQEPLRPHPPA